jgi:homoserine kinase type II
MAIHMRLKKDDLLEILRNYNIDSLVQFHVLEGGSTNTNYLVEVDNHRKFVLTICDVKSYEETLVLAKLLVHLEENQFATSKVIRSNSGKSVTLFKRKPLLLKEYISGEVTDYFNEEILLMLGSTLAKLHKIPLPDYLPKNFPYGEQIFGDLSDRLGLHPFTNWLSEKQNYLKKSLLPGLPKSLIHGDVFSSNVIITERQHPIIMDFEEAGYYYRIFDLGMAIVGLCCKNGKIILPNMHTLIHGYQQLITLTNEEKVNLKAFIVYAASATAFWRFRQFNIIYPTDALKESYLEMCNIADHAFNLTNKEIFDRVISN